MEPGAGQAARPWRPILPFEVEEDSGMGLRWSYGPFHRHSPYIPGHWPLVGFSDPWRDHLEGEWGCSTKQGVQGSKIRKDGTPGFQAWCGRTEHLQAAISPSGKCGAQLGLGRTLELRTSRPQLCIL